MRNTIDQKRILLVFPVVPYPARANGISIRYLPIIQHLSNHHHLDAIIFDDQNLEIDKLKKYFESITVVGKPEKGKFGLIKKIFLVLTCALPWTTPISFAHYNTKGMLTKLKLASGTSCYDCIIWVAPMYANYIFALAKIIKPHRVVIDFIDSPYLHSQRESVGSFRIGFIQRYESWKTKLWEQRLVSFTNSCIYISTVDAQAISPNNNKNTIRHVIPNGVFSHDYSHARLDYITSPCIGFLGNMQYPPNIEAALWLYNEVFVPLRERMEELTLYIVGKNPVESIISLSNDKNVIVTGTVENIWPHVNAIDVFLFPLKRGAGMKNKLLDVMYASRPVVTSAIGNEGINAASGKELLICDTADDYIRETEKLLLSEVLRQRIGEAARQFVTTNYCIENITRDYEKIVLEG